METGRAVGVCIFDRHPTTARMAQRLPFNLGSIQPRVLGLFNTPISFKLALTLAQDFTGSAAVIVPPQNPHWEKACRLVQNAAHN